MDFEKTYNWKVHFMFISGGQEGAGQCYIVAPTWDDVCEYAKEAPYLALAEAAEIEPKDVDLGDDAPIQLKQGIRHGSSIEGLEILGIEKVNATLVALPKSNMEEMQ